MMGDLSLLVCYRAQRSALERSHLTLQMEWDLYGFRQVTLPVIKKYNE
jgi:hypothetical protein